MSDKPLTIPFNVPARETLCITRSGDVVVDERVYSQFQCRFPGQREYTWTVKVTFFPELDERGFLVDALDIERWAEGALLDRTNIGSCEQCLMRIGRSIANNLLDQNIQIMEVYVKFHPTFCFEATSYMEYTIKAE